jgi:hypothetical protein
MRFTEKDTNPMSWLEFVANQAERNTLNLRNKITIFPWENIQAELNDINNSI